MEYQAFYFEDNKGVAPVRDYILALPTAKKAKVFAYLHHLENVGPSMRRPMADYMGDRSGLYELRPGRNRVIYFYLQRNKIILLHAFLKKTEAIPEADIRVAEDRKDICETLGKYQMVNFEE